MVKKVVWSLGARNDRKEILKYWILHNKSDVYSIKLRNLFDSAINRIQKNPKIGALSNFNNIRLKLVLNYFIIYRERNNVIEILAIWDNNQDPLKLEGILND